MAAPDYSDDDVLVAALRARDEDAFAWLLDRYTGSLRRLARAHVSTDAAADEVVSEAWLAVITGIDRFEQRSSLKTWIHRIVLNLARTKGTREHRSVPFSSLASEADSSEAAVDPDRFRPAGTPGAGQLGVAAGALGRGAGDEPVGGGDPRRRAARHRDTASGPADGDHPARSRRLAGRRRV